MKVVEWRISNILVEVIVIYWLNRLFILFSKIILEDKVAGENRALGGPFDNS